MCRCMYNGFYVLVPHKMSLRQNQTYKERLHEISGLLNKISRKVKLNDLIKIDDVPESIMYQLKSTKIDKVMKTFKSIKITRQ